MTSPEGPFLALHGASLTLSLPLHVGKIFQIPAGADKKLQPTQDSNGYIHGKAA